MNFPQKKYEIPPEIKKINSVKTGCHFHIKCQKNSAEKNKNFLRNKNKNILSKKIVISL